MVDLVRSKVVVEIEGRETYELKSSAEYAYYNALIDAKFSPEEAVRHIELLRETAKEMEKERS